MTTTRVCNDCGQEKPIEALVKNTKCLHGVRKLCKSCNVIRVQKRVDPETKAAYDKKRRVEKLEELRSYDKERSRLPHRKAAKSEHTRRRKANLRGATPDDYDRDGVMAMYLLAQKLTKLTGVEMHVDHIVPLAAGGVHDVKNLQLLAAPLNMAKGAKVDFQLPWNEYPR